MNSFTIASFASCPSTGKRNLGVSISRPTSEMGTFSFCVFLILLRAVTAREPGSCRTLRQKSIGLLPKRFMRSISLLSSSFACHILVKLSLTMSGIHIRKYFRQSSRYPNQRPICSNVSYICVLRLKYDTHSPSSVSPRDKQLPPTAMTLRPFSSSLR